MYRSMRMRVYIPVFLSLCTSLLVVYSGHLYSNDTYTKIASARNLLSRGTFAIDPSTAAWGFGGPQGRTWPHFTIGSILTMVPAVVVYNAVATITGRAPPFFAMSALVTMMNLLYSALIGVCVFFILQRWGISATRAWIYALGLLFTTEILQYSSTGWSEPAALFWTCAGLALFTHNTHPERYTRHPIRAWVLWALPCAVAATIRMEYLLFFLCFIGIHFLVEKDGSARHRLRAHASAALICVSTLGIHMVFNMYRFGSFFDFGYFGGSPVPAETVPAAVAGSSALSALGDIAARFFSPSYAATFFRTYISFGRTHWFWAAPLIAGMPLVCIHMKTQPLHMRILLACTAIYCMVLPAFGTNTWCWANRYLYAVLPYPVIAVLLLGTYKRRYAPLLFGLSATGGIVALASTLVNAHYVQEILVHSYGKTAAMGVRTAHFFNAPFWHHCRLVPEQAMNTCLLAVGRYDPVSWETLRTTCLDIWPVGLTAAGVPGPVSFLLWALVCGTAVYSGMVTCRTTRAFDAARTRVYT
jgi:hypothetical protein